MEQTEPHQSKHTLNQEVKAAQARQSSINLDSVFPGTDEAGRQVDPTAEAPELHNKYPTAQDEVAQRYSYANAEAMEQAQKVRREKQEKERMCNRLLSSPSSRRQHRRDAE